jgi:hypothetical protein
VVAPVFWVDSEDCFVGAPPAACIASNAASNNDNGSNILFASFGFGYLFGLYFSPVSIICERMSPASLGSVDVLAALFVVLCADASNCCVEVVAPPADCSASSAAISSVIGANISILLVVFSYLKR